MVLGSGNELVMDLHYELLEILIMYEWDKKEAINIT